MQYTVFVLMAALLFGCSKADSPQDDHQSHDHVGVTQVSTTDEGRVTVTVEGIISGFDCAVVDLPCPSTHRGADYTNGVFTDESDFYFVVNIPQAFLTKHFLERISVTGTTYGGHRNTVEPEQIYLITNDKSVLIYSEGYYIDAGGNRSVQFTGR